MRPQYDFEHDSATHQAVDIMASHVIPLIYASQKYPCRFEAFLERLCQREDQIGQRAQKYQKIREALFNLLDNQLTAQSERYQVLASQIKFSEADIAARQQEIRTHCAFCFPEIQALQRDGQAAKLDTQGRVEIRKIAAKRQQLKADMDRLDELKSELDALRKILENPTDGVKLFYEESDLFCSDPNSGKEEIEQYLDKNIPVRDFLLAHEADFKTIANHWVHFALKQKTKRRQPMLPTYLCPYNMKGSEWVTTSTYKLQDPIRYSANLFLRTCSFYQAHFDMFEALPMLIERIKDIQQGHFKNTDNDIECDDGHEELLEHESTAAVAASTG